MDALLRSRLRRPLSRRASRIALALGLFATAGSHADSAGRFDVHASIQPRPTIRAGGGFQLDGALTPAHASAEGGGYSVDAVAAPAGACGGSDVIFSDGFEVPF